jgi:3-oxoacyl-[acyl-carrier protein] reductase
MDTVKSSQAAELTLSDIYVGDSFSMERTFTTEDVLQFANLSGDFSPLHVDPNYGAASEFRGCVVHGILLASLFSQLVGMRIPGKPALYLGQDLSFRKPVRVGETVQASAKVIGKNEPTRTILLSTEIRGAEGKVVVSGQAKVKVRGQETAPATVSPATPAGVPNGRPVALIIGASRGLGAEIARKLASRGVAVAVNYLRSADAAHRVTEQIRLGGGTAAAFKADVLQQVEIERMLTDVHKSLGGPHLLVNGATADLPEKLITELGWSQILEHLEYQVKGAMHTCQAAHPYMKAAGGGAVVNILSQVVNGAPPARMSSYVTAKYALLGFSKALAVEWAEDQIRVNMVSPGLLQTDLTQHYHDRVFKMEANRTPLKRIAGLEDVANTVAFLLGPEASFITGANLFVTGGQVMP